MSQNSNQFNITNEKGALTLLENLNVIDAIVAAAETGTLVPGNAVTITDIAGKKTRVQLATALTDKIFGFIPTDVRTNEFVADEVVRVAFRDTVMVMEASAAIAAGADLQFDPATNKVATAVGANTIIGKALEKATADADLIMVLIQTPNENASLAAISVSETIDSGVAIDAAIKITNIDNTTTGAGAITLAAPNAAMLGQVKIIEMTVDGGDVTLSLANVQGGSAATTCTWDAVGETLVLVAGSTKWNVVSEGGVTLS